MQDERDRITGRLDEALPGRVAPLRSLHGHRITEGDPDVRGWEVHGADDRRIGQVDDLLVDTQAGKARFLAVTLDLERRVLIPIGQARLDPRRDRIVIEGLRAEEAAGLQDYDGREISSNDQDSYAGDLYDEDRFYGDRRAARAAGLEPGRGTTGGADREITGELDRAVDAPDNNVLEETPVRGR